MRQKACNLRAGLERKYKAACEVFFRILQLLQSNRLFDNPANFVDQSLSRQLHVLRRCSDESDEPTRIQTCSHRDTGKCRIREPQFVAQPVGNSCSKSGAPAQNRVEDLEGIIIGIASSDSKMAQVNVELLGGHCYEFHSFAG